MPALSPPRRTVAAALGLAALCLATASVALADGDPASDVLLTTDAFLPTPAPTAAASTALRTRIEAAYANGFRVKVAVVAAPTDLGSVPSLFGRPGDYARFLGTELSLLYIGPLLVVMPAGYGVYDGGRSTAAEDAVLARLHVAGSGPDDLTASATTAVDELLRAGALASRDVLPPTLQLLAEPPVHLGRPLRVRYRVSDDSERSRVELELSLGSRQLGSLRLPSRPTAFGTTYTATWRLRRRVPRGRYRLCGVATDPAGNRSRPACTTVALV